MSFQRVMCPNCGGSMEIYESAEKISKCLYCGETYVIENASKLAQVEVDVTKDLQNTRQLLKEAVKNNDSRKVSKYADMIRAIIPEDYTANYYFAYGEANQGNTKYLYDFYDANADNCTEEEVKEITTHIIHHGDLRDRRSIENFIMANNYIDTNEYLGKYQKSFKEKRALEEHYDDIPRDVFICHSSKNRLAAQKILDSLENDGNKCWIAHRNLRPSDADNYWENIRKGIASSKLFFVISSEDAMLSNDVKREINIAKDLNKKRIEYKIDRAEHTTFFKTFFDGYKWIEAIYDDALSIVCKRVFDELENLREKKPILKTNVDIIAPHVEKSSPLNLLKRARLEIADGRFQIANNYLEKFLDIEVENSEVWWLKILIEESARNEEELVEKVCNIEDNSNFNKAMRFASEEQKEKYAELINRIMNMKSDEYFYNEGRKYLYGGLYNEKIVKKDYLKAQDLFSIGLKKGSKKASYGLALMYYNGFGMASDKRKANHLYNLIFKDLLTEANTKDMCSEFLVGNYYYIGQGEISKDFYKAVYWYERSARQGYSYAQYNLALCYDLGRGVEKNSIKAVFWYEKAAQAGNPFAQYKLGYHYEMGDGIKRDYHKGVFWYERAALQEDVDAQYRLAECYKLGRGAYKNYTTSAYWYERAAEQGNADAQYNVGLLYDQGKGVAQDTTKAFYWYEKAANQGIFMAKMKKIFRY